jgi:exonuclease III
MKIGTWNATTLKNDYSIDILTDEFRRFELDLLRVSETHIPGVGSIKLGDIEFVYSTRKDGEHRQGVGFMMNKEAAKFCLGWYGINERMLIAHFMTKKFRVSVIVVHMPGGQRIPNLARQPLS